MRFITATLLLTVSTLVSGTLLANTLDIGNAGEPQTLDPHKYNLRLEETLLTDLFLGLTTFNARGEIVPGAASGWQTSPDGLVWTFSLRPQLWSDGIPLTADDFVYAFHRLLDPKTAASLAYFMYPLKNAEAVNTGQLPPESLGVRALDPSTLEITLGSPYPYLPERLLYPTGYPVPRHVIEKVGDEWVKPENWVSNGAYQLHRWLPQAFVEFTTNPHFTEYRAPKAADRVRYHAAASEQSAYHRFRSGELHAIASFPAGELPTAQKRMQESLRMSPLLSISYLVFNTRQKPFDDARVRAALAMAIDLETLTKKVIRSGNRASVSFVPDAVTDYKPVPAPHASQPLERRIEKAAELLQQAGYSATRPLEVTLRHVSGLEGKKVNLAIAAFWKRLGVRTTLHHSELRAHFAALRQGEFEVAQAGWFGESNPEHYLGLLVSDTGDVNYGAYANPEFDALMQRAGQLPDIATRNQILREAEGLAIADYPVAPLFSVMIRRLVSPAISGWYENARDVHPARFLELD